MDSKYKIVYVLTSCRNSGPIQVLYNLTAHLDREQFEPILITLYPEREDSRLNDFTALGITHYFCPLDKVRILLGLVAPLKRMLRSMEASVVHSTGVFPDYAVSQIACTQMMTLHNYMHDDYCSKYGPVVGRAVTALQMRAVKKASKVVACSKSLSEIYREKGLFFDYICNGVNTDRYCRVTAAEKKVLREKLGLLQDNRVFVYAATFIPRKDQAFLLEVFKRHERLHDCLLLLLGDGQEWARLNKEYGMLEYVDMRGNVDNVNEYLQASDVYISSSRSEGMPNGVLEAMATGLPVLLSDIRQHRELFDVDENIGALYKLGDMASAEEAICRIMEEELSDHGAAAYEAAHGAFNAETMSKKYQEIYVRVTKQCENRRANA